MNDQTQTLEFSPRFPSGSGAASSPISSAHLPAGTVLGQYRIVRLIAAGGMGQVYEAIQLNLDRRVALKVVADHLTSQPEFLQRFEREAKAAALINHPNIVQVYDFGCGNGQYYLAMEYVDGCDLSELLRARGKLEIDEALNVVEQTASALSAAFQQRIIHRDIKPSNLLLAQGGAIKVSDLGLAKRLDDVSEMTLAGSGLGSPHFLAPEQAGDAGSADHRADIYSLGITLLYLLTGKRPFDRSSAFSIVLAHAQQPLPSGAELGVPLPESIEDLIRKMAAKNRDDRYSNYEELLEDIARLKGGGKIQRAHSNSRKYVWGAVAVIIGAAIIFGFAHRKPQVKENKQTSISTPSANPERAFDGPESGRGPRQGPPPWEGEEDGGPGPGPGFGRQAGMQRARFPMPMPPPSMPERDPLPAGPIPEMLKAVEAFAKKNPNSFRPIVNRYNRVMQQAEGTQWEGTVREQLEIARRNLAAASAKAISDYTARMNKFVQARKFQEAYDVWRDFPDALRTWETDRAIEEKVSAALPPDFFPQVNR